MSRHWLLICAAAGPVLAPAAHAQDPKAVNYIDAHVHVWTPDTERYPLAPGFTKDQMKPDSFTAEELFKHCKPTGVRRVNLIQMSFYGFENSYMLDMIAKNPGVFVGTAVIDPLGTDPAGQMGELAKEGVRAFRIHPKLSRRPVDEWLRPEGYRGIFAAGARNNQAMSCLIGPDGLPELDRMCAAFPDTPRDYRPPGPHRRRRGDPGCGRGPAVRHGQAQKGHAQGGRLLRAGQEGATVRRPGAPDKAGRDRLRPEALHVGERLPVPGAGRAHVQGERRLGPAAARLPECRGKEWLLRKTAEGLFFGK